MKHKIRINTYCLSATLLICTLLTACGGGSGGGSDVAPPDPESVIAPPTPPGSEQRPVDDVTAPNNSKILTGDQIGTGNYAVQDLRREIAFAVVEPDDPDFPDFVIPPEPGLEIVSAYLVQTQPDPTGEIKVSGTIKNTTSYIRCSIGFPFVQFLDANGDDVGEPFVGDNLDDFFTGPVRKAPSGDLRSQCLDPGESAYFGGPNMDIEYDDVASVRLGFSDMRYSNWEAPPESVVPVSYTATPDDDFPFTNVNLTIKNVGPAIVQFKAATLIAIDENGIPLTVLRNERDLEPAGEPRLLAPEEEAVVEFSTSYQGIADIVHASVDFDECSECTD